MTAALSPSPATQPDLSDSLPASRIMRERDEARRDLSEIRREMKALREEVIDLEVERDAALANNRGAWAEAKRLEESRLALIGENERLLGQLRDAKYRAEVNANAVSQCHAQGVHQSNTIYRLQREIAEAKAAAPPEVREIEKLRERVSQLESALRTRSGECADYRNLIGELLENPAIGEPCEACRGSQRVLVEHDAWAPGSGHYAIQREEDCDEDECFNGRSVKR